VHQLAIKVLNIIDALCNHEIYTIQYISSHSSSFKNPPLGKTKNFINRG